jgi:AcrR family transcriptional regulator
VTRGEGTKERIERTALRLFVARGIAETSIRDIARAAGISQGALYNHYPSKDELAWSLFASNFSRTAAEMRRRTREQPTLAGKLQAMIRYIFRQFDNDWEMVTYVFTIRHQHLKKYHHQLGNPYIVIRAVIADAMKRGEIPRQDLELATALVTGTITQVIDSKILGRIRDRLGGLADRTAAACLRFLSA